MGDLPAGSDQRTHCNDNQPSTMNPNPSRRKRAVASADNCATARFHACGAMNTTAPSSTIIKHNAASKSEPMSLTRETRGNAMRQRLRPCSPK